MKKRRGEKKCFIYEVVADMPWTLKYIGLARSNNNEEELQDKIKNKNNKNCFVGKNIEENNILYNHLHEQQKRISSKIFLDFLQQTLRNESVLEIKKIHIIFINFVCKG